MGESDPDAAAFGYSVSPIRPVFVSPFFMDQYEVTNERYIACVQEGKCWLEPSVLGEIFDIEEHMTEDQRHRPFTWVNPWLADNFCRAQGGRLPSEAEWERAAAGLGDKPRPYPSGAHLPTCEEEVIRTCFPGVEWPKPARVGTKPPNPEGLYDLGGNVSELTREPSRFESYSECKDPCKNPCILCDKPFPPPPITPQKWSEFGIELFIARGGGVLLDPTQIIDANGEKITSDHFFRSQGRHQTNRSILSSYSSGFRCVYPAKPLR
jgi:formylglycine-generating enzyme required for sulfatase activity